MLSLYVAVCQGAPAVILRDTRSTSQHFAVVQGRLPAVLLTFYRERQPMYYIAVIRLVCLLYTESASRYICVIRGALPVIFA